MSDEPFRTQIDRHMLLSGMIFPISCSPVLVRVGMSASGVGVTGGLHSAPESRSVDESAPNDPRPRLRVVGPLGELADEELMERYRDGETAAFDVLVLRYRDPLFGFIRRVVPDAERAEEILGDVFLKLHRAAPRYEVRARFRTYLYTIAWRAALNAADRARNQLDSAVGGDAELPSNDPVQRPAPLASDPERSVVVSRQLAALERELATLPAAHRAAFLLYYRGGLSCAEVAATLDISPAEAKGRLAYARKLLRDRLQPLLREQAP